MLSNTVLLQRFLKVVELGSLHAAADNIGVTQPALTRSLHLLEDSIGEPIFEKRGRNLTLTPLGEVLAEQSKHLLREQQLAEAELMTFRKGERGNLRLGAASLWMAELLPKVLANVSAIYPSLQVTLSSMNYNVGLAGLKDGSIDAFFGGFQTMESLPSFLVRKPLFVARLVVIARKDHPIFQAPMADIETLTRYNWMSFQSDAAYLNHIAEEIRRQSGDKLNVTVQCDSMTTTLELLRHGDHLAFLPSSFLALTGETGLAIVDTNLPDVQFNSGPIYRRSLQQNAAFATLLDQANQQVKNAKLPAPQKTAARTKPAMD